MTRRRRLARIVGGIVPRGTKRDRPTESRNLAEEGDADAASTAFGPLCYLCARYDG